QLQAYPSGTQQRRRLLLSSTSRGWRSRARVRQQVAVRSTGKDGDGSESSVVHPRRLRCVGHPHPSPDHGRASASRGGTVHRRELRADREQPPVAVAGVVAAPVAQDQQGEAVRRRPARPARVPRHGRGVRGRHRQRGRPGDGQPRGGGVVAAAARGAAPPRRRAHHLHHRRQRGVQGQRHRPPGQPPPGDAVRAPGARRARPPGPRQRHHRALAGHHGRVLPAVRRCVPPLRRAAPAAVPGLPVGGEGAVPHQLLPVLRLQGRPGARAAGVRAVPAQRRRRRPAHEARLRQHAVRAGGRRVRGDPGDGAHGHRREGVGDRVAVPRRPRRGRRDARERRDVHREPPPEDRDEAGHAAAAAGAHRRLRLRALQREPQARPGVGAELRPLLPRRHAGLQRRPPRLPPAHGITRGSHPGDPLVPTYRHRIGRFRLIVTVSATVLSES
uniref:Uncharacterized protein n=1 Tax=Oryza nivara TaxID=4536 RepID=A0A0E0G7R1_ORYNI